MTVDQLATRVRWLTAYAVGTTALLGGLLLSAAASKRHASFDEIDVGRINVRKPDGRLSMVIANEDRMPGVIAEGREYGSREGVSGMLFFDGDGNEMGGLTYGSRRAGRSLSHSGHLAFDGHRRDQALALTYREEWEGGERTTYGGALRFVDRHGPPGTERAEMAELSRTGTEAERARAAAWFREHGRYGEDWANRVVIASADGRAYVGLNDPQGRPRVEAAVDSAGQARVETLDAAGEATASVGR